MEEDFSLRRDAFGALIFERAGVSTHGVVAVRAFPILAPGEGISLVSPEGRELAWIDQLANLSAENRELVESELAKREFMPEVSGLIEVSSFATPCKWRVSTDRGLCEFILRGEEDIRRLPGGGLLIADSHGIHFLIRDPAGLDRHSRKLLDRFL